MGKGITRKDFKKPPEVKSMKMKQKMKTSNLL